MGLADRENKKRAGKIGGKVGGVKRAAKLTKAQRTEIASKGGYAKRQHASLPNKKSSDQAIHSGLPKRKKSK